MFLSLYAMWYILLRGLLFPSLGNKFLFLLDSFSLSQDTTNSFNIYYSFNVILILSIIDNLFVVIYRHLILSRVCFRDTFSVVYWNDSSVFVLFLRGAFVLLREKILLRKTIICFFYSFFPPKNGGSSIWVFYSENGRDSLASNFFGLEL